MYAYCQIIAVFILMALASQDNIDPIQESEETKFHSYGYRKGGTPAQVFSQTLARAWEQ